MLDTCIILSATWVVVTLIYLYGDVFRIYSGDFAKMANMNFNQFVWLGPAILANGTDLARAGLMGMLAKMEW